MCNFLSKIQVIYLGNYPAATFFETAGILIQILGSFADQVFVGAVEHFDAVLVPNGGIQRKNARRGLR